MTVQPDWVGWQRSWDLQQEGHLPDREERFGVLLSLVAAVEPRRPLRVLDLACGCGSITARLLKRFPEARVVALDLDPVLLRIAREVFAGDGRVEFVEADLRRPDWAAALPAPEFDAVLSATALHWLRPVELEGVYRGMAAVVRPGGLFADADHVPLESAAGLGRAASRLRPEELPGRETWELWWQRVATEPKLAELLAERRRRFGSLHSEGSAPSDAWHLRTLRAAGFSEAAVVWRRGPDAVVAALR